MLYNAPMANLSRNLTFVVPGLFGPPGLRAADFSMLNCSTLELLLSRAARDSVPAKGLEATLFHLFEVARDPACDLPIAAVTRMADTGVVSDAFWMRADPVHLRADQVRLILFDSHALSIHQEEADALVAQFNAFFSAGDASVPRPHGCAGTVADGWYLEAPHPGRWYLRLPEDPRIRNYDLSEVLGQHIDGFLPTGTHGKRWHTVLNEIQMLFHASPINQAREARRAMTINSVWLWGSGRTPEVAACWDHVWSNQPVAAGLARLANIPHAPVPPAANVILQDLTPGKYLVVLDELHADALYGIVDAWGAGLERIARLWFAPLVEALKQRQVDSVVICAADGRMFRITPSLLRRFWKRRRSLEAYL